MKRFLKALGVLGVASAFAFSAASCSNATQKYADKINEEAGDDDGKYVTYEEAKKKLGDECIDITVTLLGSTNGVLVACKGVKTQEDLQAKLNNGEEVKGIVITVVNNNCVAATYKTIQTSDLKK